MLFLDSEKPLVTFIRDPLHLQSGHVKSEGFVKAQLPLSAFAAL